MHSMMVNNINQTETEQDGASGRTVVLQIKHSRDLQTSPPPSKRRRLQSPTTTSVPPTTTVEPISSSLPPLAQQIEALSISPPSSAPHQVLPRPLFPLQNNQFTARPRVSEYNNTTPRSFSRRI